jgi:hypothetical protein
VTSDIRTLLERIEDSEIDLVGEATFVEGFGKLRIVPTGVSE